LCGRREEWTNVVMARRVESGAARCEGIARVGAGGLGGLRPPSGVGGCCVEA
jgi:hypothetical protein